MKGARPLVVVCSSGAVILGVISIYLLLAAYSSYRSVDFVFATNTSDFASMGTCIETVTDEIVEDANFMDESWKCADKRDSLARLLLSQTHSIYYLQKTTTVSQDVSDLAHTLLAATIGHSSMSLNVSIAYNVLRSLDDDNFTVPRDCSSVYTGITPEFYDTANQKLPTIECGATLVGSNPSNFSALDKGKLLYACTKQFSFGRSGPHHETYGIPLLNEPAGPLYEFAFNATLPWTAKSRSFIGYRFGWALFAYVPCMLCLAFLSIDAMLVLLVETTIKYRNSGIVQTAVDLKGSTIFQKLQARLATYIRERDVRLTFGILLALNATVMMSLFVWLPWGVSSPRLGRPVCDEGQDADVDPHFAYLFYFKTKGGWQPDVSCLFLEVCVIAAQFFILLAIPLARKVSDVQPADSNAPEKVSRWVDVVRGARGGGFLIFATVVAIILLIAGNAWAGSIFGNAWARGVAEESDLGLESMLGSRLGSGAGC